MRFVVNGSAHDLEIDTRMSLLDLLRERLKLAGTKKGCDQGACGACTVLADGERVNSCLALAVQYQGREIRTIEGLGSPDASTPFRRPSSSMTAFSAAIAHRARICSAIGMASEARRGVPSHVTRDLRAERIALDHYELRERMSGNLCRCGAYNGIIDAIWQVFGDGTNGPGKRLCRADRPTSVASSGRIVLAEEDA